MCDCGRKRGLMNSANWSRHKESCKSKKIKLSHPTFQNNCISITKFFNPRNSIDTKCTAVSGNFNYAHIMLKIIYLYFTCKLNIFKF